MKHTGGCFCGQVRYEFEGDEKIPCADCHCTLCRRTSGAPYVSWLVVPEADFQYTGAAPKTIQSSANGTRFFCENCGTHVACMLSTHPEVVDLTLGSLDNPEAFTPIHTVFEDTRLSFVTTHAMTLAKPASD